MTPQELAGHIRAALLTVISSGQLDLSPEDVPAEIVVERPKNLDHGDWANNVAMQVGKKAGLNPRAAAEILQPILKELPGVEGVEIAGPGFINIRLDAASQGELARDIIAKGKNFGRGSQLAGKKINVEFISANPTGPLHLGHTRWAAVGDAIARVLEAEGAESAREFYINDLGVQKVKQNEFHAYDILLDPSQKRDLGSSKHLFKIKPAYLAGIAVVILALGGGFLFFQKSLNKNKISSTEFAYEIPSKPSLAVMPFKYLSEDQSEEYISLGLTQNITNALSRSSEIFIISYSSAKKAAETLPDPASISKALGVKYILTGSVQKMDKNLRVNVELVDVLKGNNVWVNQIDGTVDNLFMFQDQITDNIFENFQINLLSSVIGKSSSNFSSVDEMREVMRFREYFLNALVLNANSISSCYGLQWQLGDCLKNLYAL